MANELEAILALAGLAVMAFSMVPLSLLIVAAIKDMKNR